MLTAGPGNQFPRWRRTRKRLSVCSVLRCPDLRLQFSMSFMHGLKKDINLVWCFFSWYVPFSVTVNTLFCHRVCLFRFTLWPFYCL
jgi:hypothetical protein